MLKKADDEVKMCCLFVKDEYRCNGIGSSLMERSFEALNNNKPLATVSETNLPKVERVLKKYNFELSRTTVGEYVDGEREFYFN